MIIDAGYVSHHTKKELELVGMVWTPAPVNLIVTKCSSMFALGGDDVDYEDHDEERHPEHEDDTPEFSNVGSFPRKTPKFLTVPDAY